MIYEKSCGAVIYYELGNVRYYLIEHMVKGHSSLCKGHVEGNETEIETAAREIQEETALQVTFIDGFRECIEYSPYSGCMKLVVFFLAQSKTQSVTAQPEEVRSISWMPFNDALDALTHASDKDLLCKADAFLSHEHS